MTNIVRTALVTAFVLFGVVNSATLNDGHNWGDDFAQYMLHAVNLTEHKPYAADIVLDLWTVVPPGFPLILSSIIYWAGINFKLLKFLNIMGWALTALAGYSIAVRRMTPAMAAALTIWFLSAPSLFVFKQNVLSDIPFVCFVSLSIWAFIKYQEKLTPALYVLTVFLMSYCVLVRWAGISLVAAAVLYCAIKREGRQSIGFIIGACVAVAIGLSFGAGAGGHFESAQYTVTKWLYDVWMNIAFLPTAFLDIVITVPAGQMMNPAVFTLCKFPGPAAVLLGCVIFFRRLLQKRISFLGCFTFLYLMGVILWPVQQGASRYILPVIIPLMIYVLASAKDFKVGERVLVGVLMLLICQNIFVTAGRWTFKDDDIYQPETLEMASWVADHVPPTEHYMFRKPRALKLLTNRVGTAYWVYPADEQYWHLRAQRLNVKYFIADKKLDGLAGYDTLTLPVAETPWTLTKVWENSRYKILRAQ